jgi:glycosyltransferase involved in cell wall biosynthesis
MKIGIDIRSLMDKKYSGVSWHTFFLLEEILRQDKQNEYALFYNSGRDISSRMPKFEQANVKVVATRYPNKIFNYLLQKILKWPKLDKLLFLSKESVPALSVAEGDIFWSPHLNFTALSQGVRRILTVYDLSFLDAPQFFSARQNFWHKILNAPKFMAQADILVAISENTKRDMVRLLGIDENKIKVIYCGVEKDFRRLEKTDENLAAIKGKYNLPDKFILYLGTIEPRKNISGLLEAFERIADKPEFKDYQLVIVGGSGWKNSQIYRAIDNSKHGEKIKLVGYIDNSEKIYFYNLCSVFCYPSFYEGFGLPVLEAMACGAPVVTSNTSSLPEVVGDAALLIDPNDEQTIAEALNALMSNEKLREAYSARGLKRSKIFSWGKAASEYIKLFYNKS